MAGPKFPLMIRFRATRADGRTLKKLAAHHQRTESDVMRLLLAEAWASIEARAAFARDRAAKKKSHAVATE